MRIFSPMTRAGAACALGLLVCLPGAAPAQDEADPKKKDAAKPVKKDVFQRSLPLRTALHHDPTLSSPLERLLTLFRKAKRTEELLGVYRSHLNNYPQDYRARIVLGRLLLATNDANAETFIRQAVGMHPQNAYLSFLLYTILKQDNDPRSLDHLDRAILRALRPTRKRAWIQLLLKEAVAYDRLSLAKKHLADYATLLGGTAAAHLAAARKMHEYGFHAEALSTVLKGLEKSPSPETGVELELFAATVEVAQKKHAAASARLDKLLSRLTADYWRRAEILRRRARLIRSPEERQKLVKKARATLARNPASESAALDLSRLLAGFDRHREALKVLLASGKKLPNSLRLEKETLELFDRLREERGREEYLAKRIERFPERRDLIDQRMRTLFLLGKKRAAIKLLDALVAEMGKSDKVKRLLETARFLRAQAFPMFAAGVFAKVVELAPERLDLRRELAETHLASGDRLAAHRVLNAKVPRRVETTLLLDLVQLMIREELFSASKRALAAKLQQAPDSFPLLLALLEVEGRLGNGASGKVIIAKTRSLADSKTRYRRWLEQSISFYEMFEASETFLKQEQERLQKSKGKWDARRVDRVLTFSDINAQHQRNKEVAKMISGFLKLEGLPGKVRIRLKRQLVSTMETDPKRQKEAEAELLALSKEDPEREEEYRARLAALYIFKKRHDKARPLLENLNISLVSNADLLSRLQTAYTELRNTEKVLAVLERIATVDPGNKANWEKWITALASRGEENRLRGAIRRVLRGGPKLKIDPPTRRRLRAHLADSYWRSTGILLSKRTEVANLEALELLDQIERAIEVGPAWVWLTWARAYALNALGRTKARDAVLVELERAYEKLEPKKTKKKKDPQKKAKDGTRPRGPVVRKKRFPAGPIPPGMFPPPRNPLATPGSEADDITALPGKHIRFPDGLSASRAEVRRILTSPALEPPAKALADRQGPVPPLRVRWAFETYAQAKVSGVFPLGPRKLLISDQGGNVYGVDRASGKLLWSLEAVCRIGPAVKPVVNPYSSYSYRRYYPQPKRWPATIPVPGPRGEGFYVPHTGKLIRYTAQGKKHWEIELGSKGKAPLQVVAQGNRVLVFDPSSGLAAGVDPASAKVVWLTRLPTPSLKLQPQANTVGVAAGGGRFFVYGAWSAILSARTGDVLWSFEPYRVRRFPIKLSDMDDMSDVFGKKPSPTAPNPFVSRRRIYSSGRSYVGSSGYANPYNMRYNNLFLSYLERSKKSWQVRPTSYGGTGPKTTAVVAPAAGWTTYRFSGQTRAAHIAGNRLLLFRGGGTANGVDALDLNMPLFGKHLSVSGTPVGVYAGVLVMLNARSLMAYDLKRRDPLASVRTLSLNDLVVKGKPERLQACIDRSGTVYVSGAGGVTAANATTLRRMFAAPWPKIVAPAQRKLSVRQYVSYGFRGVHVRNQQTYYYGSPQYHYWPLVGMAADKVLYATSDPARVVALAPHE